MNLVELFGFYLQFRGVQRFTPGDVGLHLGVVLSFEVEADVDGDSRHLFAYKGGKQILFIWEGKRDIYFIGLFK